VEKYYHKGVEKRRHDAQRFNILYDISLTGFDVFFMIPAKNLKGN